MDQQDERQRNNVENIPSAIELKHPLQYEWTLYYFEKKNGMDWAACMQEVYTFGTVEDFWCMYQSIKSATELSMGCDYYVFKTGIKPMWEDERNRNGGRWLFTVDTRMKYNLDNFWTHTLLYMIGESFDESGEDICGTCINLRGKGDKISLWTGDANNKDTIMEIGKVLKEEVYKLPNDVKIHYERHADAQSKTSSRAKCMFQI